MTKHSDINTSPRKPRHTREINYTEHEKLTPRHQASLKDDATKLIRQMRQGGIRFSCKVLEQIARIFADACAMWSFYGKKLFEIHHSGETGHWPEPARKFLSQEFRTVSPHRLAKDLDNKKSIRLFKELVELLLRQSKVIINPKDNDSPPAPERHRQFTRDTFNERSKHSPRNAPNPRCI